MAVEPGEADAALTSAPAKNKPKNTPFRQQTLKAYKPVPTVKSAVIIFTTISFIFIVVGSILLSYSLDIKEVRERYDNVDGCKDSNWEKPGECVITMDVKSDMDSPVFFYYELDNFYQNHRRYVKSKNNKQLSGTDVSEGDLEDCEPVITMDDLERREVDLAGGKTLDSGDVANPCGLIAKSIFNDTFSLVDPSGKAVKIEFDDIAWSSDKDRKFSRESDKWEKNQWLDVEDEHFMVWMRTSGLPNFRKLWGRIEDDMPEGKYKVTVKSIYDVSDFDGEKWIVLSTANALGGNNTFLGIAYLVVGGITFILAIVFAVKGYFYKRRIENDHSA